MIDIGFYSIAIALFLAFYSVLSAVLGIRSQRREMLASAEHAAYSVCGFLTLASVAMIVALVTRNFQIEYVARYTNKSLPMIYTLTAFYAGQKGSLLFWGWILSIFTAIVIFQNRKKNRDLLPYVLIVLMTVTSFFVLLMVFITNPFETYNFVPSDGKGLNPMLQNPGMIFHPPALFLGYVGFAVPFAFAIAALMTGRLGDTWIKTTRKWTLFAWFFLTAGNLLGMEWAYVELGWGGYWAWDPVENASFMPWIVGTAYLHSVMIQEKRGMLKVWNIVLILLTFLLTIFGTFITRSGLIASVHSFGESNLGWAFLFFLAVALLFSLGLLLYRLPDLKSRNQLDSLISRESSFLFNNLLFVGIAFTVLWGTLFPIISEAVRGIKITVGAPFYNSVVSPIGLALLLLTGVCPLIGWRKTTLAKLGGKILIPSIMAVSGFILFYLAGIRPGYTLITLSFCVFVSTTLLLEFFTGTRTRHAVFDESYPRAFWNLVSKNKRRYGGHIVHFGVVLIFMAFSANAFNSEKQVTLQPGQTAQIQNYTLRYDGLAKFPTANKQKIVATLALFKGQRQLGVLSPEKSLYTGQEQPTTDVAIRTTLKEDLYVILAGYDENSATFIILVNPLVIWLWIGGGIMGFGTCIVMLPARRRQRATAVNARIVEAA